MMSTTETIPARPAAAADDDRLLLIVDDDAPFRNRLTLAMERRGWRVISAGSLDEGIDAARNARPSHAIIDLRLGDGSGLDVVGPLHEMAPDCRVVILTAYGNLATAVAAVKAGAVDYLSKPADADAVESALLADDDAALPPPPEDPMPADRVRWEHIQRVYEQCERNVSETARRLKMHRRTLQRILAKHAPRAD